MQGTCDLYDAHKETARIPLAGFRDFGSRKAFAGIAVTVRCLDDNSRVKDLSATDGRGKVLVVDGGESRRCALMGDMIAAAFAQNGWEGVIIAGCVRDIEVLATIDLGIKALDHTPRASVRRGLGDTGCAVVIGEAACHPGDRVFADADGIVFLPPA